MEVNAFDTETIDGLAVLMASRQKSAWVKSWTECMDFLFSHTENVWFCYNLDYDFQALIKYLPRREIEYLHIHGRVVYNDITIEYIRGKYAGFTGQIKEGSKSKTRTLQVYDLYQFYNKRLDSAAKKFLKKSKRDISKKIISDLASYLDRNRINPISKRVRRYCEKDAQLTCELADLLLKYLDLAGIAVKKFFSYGYIAKQIIKDCAPSFRVSWEHEKFIRSCYYGGRIECLQRGSFKRGYVYDLVSAYPAHIRNLPDLVGARVLFEKKPAGYVSFIECKIDMPGPCPIGPFPWRQESRPLCYPNPSGRVIRTTSVELKVFRRHYPKARIEYIRCLNVHVMSRKKPFKALIDRMFNKRFQGNEAEKYLYKIILNSIYGAFGEQTPKYRRMTEGEEHYQYRRDSRAILRDCALETYGVANHRHWECQCSQCKKYRRYAASLGGRGQRDVQVVQTQDGPYKRCYKPGRRYNPVYFGLTTAGTRADILNAALTDLPSEPLLLMTDGIIFKRFPKALTAILGDRMGQWAFKGVAKDLCIVGTGVYEYDKSDGSTVTKFRGFDTRWSLRKKIKRCTRSTKIKVPSLQNVSIGLVCKQTKAFAFTDLNKLLKKEKRLDVNFDTKRKWSRPFRSASECLQIRQKSEVKT